MLTSVLQCKRFLPQRYGLWKDSEDISDDLARAGDKERSPASSLLPLSVEPDMEVNAPTPSCHYPPSSAHHVRESPQASPALPSLIIPLHEVTPTSITLATSVVPFFHHLCHPLLSRCVTLPSITFVILRCPIM